MAATLIGCANTDSTGGESGTHTGLSAGPELHVCIMRDGEREYTAVITVPAPCDWEQGWQIATTTDKDGCALTPSAASDVILVSAYDQETACYVTSTSNVGSRSLTLTAFVPMTQIWRGPTSTAS